MTANEAESRPPGKYSDDNLPSVEPPTAGFILQLFLIPLLIVTIVIMLWLLFSWLAHAGKDDPQTVLRDLRRMGTNSWQRAYELANLLGAKDAQGEALRHDSALAAEVSKLLTDDLQQNPGEIDPGKAKMRMYLCRTLSSFQIDDVVPALVQALGHEGGIDDVQVRIGAAESLAILAKNLGHEQLRDRSDVIQGLIAAASRDDKSEQTDNDHAQKLIDANPKLKSDYRPHAELRAVAAYALGVIGGKEATDKLHTITQIDPYSSARYNAATGLARQGDERVIGTLLEMLDPANAAPADNEWHETEKEQQRVNVLKAGMQAALRLAEMKPELDLTKVEDALKKLGTDELPNLTQPAAKRTVAMHAQETLRLMEKTRAEHAAAS